MSPRADRADGDGWRLAGRAVWVAGGAVAARLGEALRAAGAGVSVSPAAGAGAWAGEAGSGSARLDGLVLVLDDPRAAPPPAGRPPDNLASAVTERLGAIFATVRAAARRMPDGGAVVVVAPEHCPEHWAGGLTPEPVAASLETLVRSLAVALGPAGIPVNLLSVRLASGEWPGDPGPPIVGPIAYLLARETVYLTGRVLRVDPAPGEPTG
jgi:NAD(P)-dependent dehydrogenase (short-subunit alcohol dehydrogenase family)